MNKNFRRYAVYWRPEPGAFADFGAAWLGWNPATGITPSALDIAGLNRATLTSTPRKYGFHGTIKPPFRLTRGAQPAQIIAELDALAQTMTPVALDGLHLTQIGSFLALTPLGDQTVLGHLAAQVVKGLDHFRAPPSETELTRRRAAGLTASQEAHLMRWGYPYVMDEFRFHLTLTGKLDDPGAIRAALAPHITPLLPAPFQVTALTLLGEDDDGMFHDIHRAVLSG